MGIYYQGNPLALTLKKQKAQETEGRQGFGTKETRADVARGAKFENVLHSTAISLILTVFVGNMFGQH